MWALLLVAAIADIADRAEAIFEFECTTYFNTNWEDPIDAVIGGKAAEFINQYQLLGV